MHRSLRLLLVLGLLAPGLAGGGALAQEREWSLDASDQEAYLIFGVADSDDVGVSFWCPLKKGLVNLYVPRPTAELARLDRRKVPLTLKVGGESETFGGKIDLNRDGLNSSVEVEMPADSKLLKAMAVEDRFGITVGGEDMVFPLYGADVPTLLDFCRKG